MAVKGAKARAEEIARRKAETGSRRGDRTKGRSKTPWGPRGGRNAGGRGRERQKPKRGADGDGAQAEGGADDSPQEQEAARQASQPP